MDHMAATCRIDSHFHMQVNSGKLVLPRSLNELGHHATQFWDTFRSQAMPDWSIVLHYITFIGVQVSACTLLLPPLFGSNFDPVWGCRL